MSSVVVGFSTNKLLIWAPKSINMTIDKSICGWAMCSDEYNKNKEI